MLPREHRLNKSADLRRVMRRGRRFLIPEAAAFVMISEQSQAKLGVIVPKAVGNAVVRHAVARRIRHGFQPLLTSSPAAELVVRAQTGADSLSVADWTELARRAIAGVSA